MQRARDQFLAGAGFAANADARFAGGDVLDLRHHFLHRRARPHDVMPAEAALEVAIFFLEVLQAQRVFDGEQQLFGGDRLLEKIDGAQPRGLHRHFDGGLSGHHHHGRCDADGFEIFEQRDAVAAGHDDVGKNQVEALGFGQFQGARGVVADGGFVAGEPKGASERGESVRVVVNDKDVGFRGHRAATPRLLFSRRPSGTLCGLCGGFMGNSMWKEVPTPVSLSTEMRPP